MTNTEHGKTPARSWFARAGVAHGLAAVSAVMLIAAAIGWLSGGPEIIGERTGLGTESTAAPAMSGLLGFYKGILDLWPLPLALWFALRRDPTGAALVWVVAVVVIPIADIAVNAMAGRPWGDAVVHLPYILVMSLTAAAYAAVARRGG
jgi:hypothetical protein